jgi:Fic family protein
MRRTYIHERADWPRFHWDLESLSILLAHVRHVQGRLRGRMEAVGFSSRQEALLVTLTSDVVKTSEIEGEMLEPYSVRSSIARHLGMDIGGLKSSDRHVDGVVEVTLDATQNYDHRLTQERLQTWHTALFPSLAYGGPRFVVGDWRTDETGPMQVVSGPLGKQTVHFVAPEAKKLPNEMAAFLEWFNSPPEIDLLLKAAMAHLWFVTIHPFDDGNGRIARAIADMALSRSEDSSQRFYSMSAQIRNDRSAYYDILERTQQQTLDITEWMEWFLNCLGRAIENASGTLERVLMKSRFWEDARAFPLNDRQISVLNRLLDGFEGKLTTSKYAKLAKCSHDTALRDVQSLIEWGLLGRNPEGGRSTSYSLIWQQ